MTVSTADIDASIDALTAALGRDELRVRLADGREVTYVSVAELQERLSALRRERAAIVAVTSGTQTFRSLHVRMLRS